MPLPLTVSCFSKIQIGFTFLVLAHPGSSAKRAVKRGCVLRGKDGLWWNNLVVVCSFPPPSFPPTSRFGEVAGHAFSIAIVSFAVSISMGKLFAKKHNYSLDSNQVNYCLLYLFFVIYVCALTQTITENDIVLSVSIVFIVFYFIVFTWWVPIFAHFCDVILPVMQLL